MNSIENNQEVYCYNKLKFYREISNNIPALVYVNQLTDSSNLSSLQNIWSNKFAQKFVGYSKAEIKALGYNYFKQIIYSQDFDILVSLTNESLCLDQIFSFIYRLIPRDSRDYKWMYGYVIPLKKRGSDNLKVFMTISIEIANQIQTEDQLAMALRDINKRQHETRCQSLSNREKEFLRCVAMGLTDAEIAAKLFISFSTAKTHRNRIKKKLGLKNTACLVAFAVECGLC